MPSDKEDEDQFSCTKIADSLDDLDVDYKFRWGKRYDYEVELVPAVQNPDGTLDRQIVHEPVVEGPHGLITPLSEEIYDSPCFTKNIFGTCVNAFWD